MSMFSSGAALLVIGLQRNKFEASRPVWDALGVLARISELVARARAAGVPVIWVRNNGGPGDPDEHGTSGWELMPVIPRLAGEPIVDKEMNDAFAGTSLDSLLKSRGARTVVVCGPQSECCIQATCRGAVKRGYKVILVSDGHLTFDSAGVPVREIVSKQTADLAKLARSFHSISELYGPQRAKGPVPDTKAL